MSAGNLFLSLPRFRNEDFPASFYDSPVKFYNYAPCSVVKKLYEPKFNIVKRLLICIRLEDSSETFWLIPSSQRNCSILFRTSLQKFCHSQLYSFLYLDIMFPVWNPENRSII